MSGSSMWVCPLAVEFAKAGFSVVGIDIDSERVAMLNAGHSYLGDVNEVELASLVAGGRLRAVQDYRVVSELDAVSICVPTPLSLGVAYKRDVTDWRALEIIRLLRLKGALVEYHDPLVATIKVDGVVDCSRQLTAEALRGPDCTVIVTDHALFDWRWIVEESSLVLDTRNTTRALDSSKVIKL